MEEAAGQCRQLLVVYALGLCVVCGEAYVALVFAWFEARNVTAVEGVEHGMVGAVVAHTVENFKETGVALAIDMGEFYHCERRLAQGVAAEEVGRVVVTAQQCPLFILGYGGKLAEVANHKHLHAAERGVAATITAKRIIDSIKQIGTHHAYLVDDKCVDGTYDANLLFAETELSAA